MLIDLFVHRLARRRADPRRFSRMNSRFGQLQLDSGCNRQSRDLLRRQTGALEHPQLSSSEWISDRPGVKREQPAAGIAPGASALTRNLIIGIGVKCEDTHLGVCVSIRLRHLDVAARAARNQPLLPVGRLSIDSGDGENSGQRAHSSEIGRIERLRLGHEMCAVLGDSLDADVQVDRDPLVGQSGGNQFQQGKFARRQIRFGKAGQFRIADPGEFLGELSMGNVHYGAHLAHRSAQIISEHLSPGLDPMFAAVRPDNAIFVVEFLVGKKRSFDCAVETSPIVRMDAFLECGECALDTVRCQSQ